MITRSKQHALMFLLGALLVGGVLGFSYSNWVHAKAKTPTWASRQGMYDDLGLTPQQQHAIDSVADLASKQMDSVFAPVQREMDAVRTSSRKTIENMMTPAQRAKYDARVKDFQDRQAKARARRDSIAKAAGKDPTANHGIRGII